MHMFLFIILPEFTAYSSWEHNSPFFCHGGTEMNRTVYDKSCRTLGFILSGTSQNFVAEISKT